ncbi:hypothetical protein ACHHYP_12256 [Achlya hypogyna]|uniref:Uncharacterized protein n=1 Tax=Achlya hypogyna TaxID=1202772 RepID=A0A1V9YHA2_ACHHY|nr:hypothetical protein ACHHYP_12256 [Achlya hypogyna]
MYIGPWQEYKLAKIQDSAIQKLKQEWEEKLKSTLADEESIRQMMQPLIAKLPGMLLETRSKPARKPSIDATKNFIPDAARVRATRSNQEVPAEPPRKQPSTQRKPQPKPKTSKAKAKPLSAMEAVTQRQQAYARWKKAEAEEVPSSARTENEPGVLPPVVPPQHMPIEGPPVVTLLRETQVVHLPPIERSARPECDDEDSVDEDELNSFLSWTDQLALGGDADLDTFLNGE